MIKKERDHLNLVCDLSDLATLVTGSQDIESFLQQTVNLMSRHLEASVCSIYFYEETSGTLVLKATRGLNPKAVGRVRMPPGEGLVGYTFDTLHPVREANASRNPLFKYFEETDEDGFESFLAVPIQRGVQKIGVLVVQHEQPGYFDDMDMMALRASASQLAGAIENVRLLIDLYEATGRKTEHPSYNELPQLIRGCSASEGYAYAPATLFKKSHVRLLSGRMANSSLFTLDDFKAAVAKTSEQVMALQSRLAKRLPESASLIFTAHFMILKDPKFIRKIESEIENGISPPDAVRKIAKHYIDIFSTSSHAYIREKVNDMEDLAGRILKNMYGARAGDEPLTDPGRIVIAAELYPSELLKLASEDVRGIVLAKGGITSHVSILARSFKIPLIIAESPQLLDLPEETPLLLDAVIGNIYVNPDEKITRQFEIRSESLKESTQISQNVCHITTTKDGVRIRLLANINLLSEISNAKTLNAEGVGLYRTEFPFIVRPTFPSEEEQYVVYKRLFDEMSEREVTIRTLDVSGDKALVYSDATKGANPEMGLRSIRFSLRHPAIFEQQIRAILRAGANADLRIMFPLISSVDEFLAAKSLVLKCQDELAHDNLPYHHHPAIGMMVEVPSVVEIMPALAKEADFFSIGTNDFVQYTLAVDRSNEQVSEYYKPYHPGVLRGLARVVKAVCNENKDISVCGEMGHEKEYLPFLLGIGIRTLSVDPQFLPSVQEKIMTMSLEEAENHTRRLLAEDTLKGVRQLLEQE